jgi:hypothetical protein
MYLCSIILLLITVWFLMRALPLDAIVLVFWFEIISQYFYFYFIICVNTFIIRNCIHLLLPDHLQKNIVYIYSFYFIPYIF